VGQQRVLQPNWPLRPGRSPDPAWWWIPCPTALSMSARQIWCALAPLGTPGPPASARWNSIRWWGMPRDGAFRSGARRIRFSWAASRSSPQTDSLADQGSLLEGAIRTGVHDGGCRPDPPVPPEEPTGDSARAPAGICCWGSSALIGIILIACPRPMSSCARLSGSPPQLRSLLGRIRSHPSAISG